MPENEDSGPRVKGRTIYETVDLEGEDVGVAGLHEPYFLYRYEFQTLQHPAAWYERWQSTFIGIFLGHVLLLVGKGIAWILDPVEGAEIIGEGIEVWELVSAGLSFLLAVSTWAFVKWRPTKRSQLEEQIEEHFESHPTRTVIPRRK